MSLARHARLQAPSRAPFHACRVGSSQSRRRRALAPRAFFSTDAYRTDDASPAVIEPIKRLRNDPFAVVSSERGFLPEPDPLLRCVVCVRACW